MSTEKRRSELLYEEFLQKPEGVFIPQYFKYIGYRKDYSLPRVLARANAIEALFTLPEAHIYTNDLIAGSIRPLFANANPLEIEHATNICANYGSRGFIHNADHFAPDYESFLDGGIPALMQKIDDSAKLHTDKESQDILASMKTCISALRTRLLMHKRKAEELMSEPGYDKALLANIKDSCGRVANDAPKTFRDALQLVWMVHTCFLFEEKYAMALGRIDQYLYPFFEKDKKDGILNEQMATELLENVFMKIYERRAYLGGDDVVNICIGGTGEDGQWQGNELSICVLDAVRNLQIPGPNLSARISSNAPDSFLDECLKVIGTGIGYPALMNDDVNKAALLRYGYEWKDVCNYCMVGCIENFITGKQPPWSDGRFDTPRFFEFLFNRGVGIQSHTVGVDTGDVKDIETMSEFMDKFETQLRYGAAEYYAIYRNENSRLNPKEYTQPFLSCFCDGCIEKAKDICDGGSKYPSAHGVALMGVGTVCDSLAAIEKTVFVDRVSTLEEIREAMLNNFEGFELLREALISAPKYGNNDPFVDKYAVWFVDFLYSEFSKYKTSDGGGMYIAMAANTSNIWAGKNISATPDGRLATMPLSDAASPTYGRDTRGATSTVNSVCKPDYSKVACGTVVNQKFSPAMFKDDSRSKLLSLIRVYFKKGGQEMQINATSREVLKDAMLHPENYGSLVVRVSGFSALYITLDRDVQLDILNRTQQN